MSFPQHYTKYEGHAPSYTELSIVHVISFKYMHSNKGHTPTHTELRIVHVISCKYCMHKSFQKFPERNFGGNW